MGKRIMDVTIVLPISRELILDRLFAGLELLECDKERTNLFVYVDGDNNLYTKTRNLVEQSKFNQRLCVQRKDSTKVNNFSIEKRRKRIADIHNEIKQYLVKSDFVFLIEDDTLLPSYALKYLFEGYRAQPYAGLVTGWELGRWGVPYIGVWRTDDVYKPSELKSVINSQGLEPIDASGLYCCLTRTEHYMAHEFKPYSDVLGADVDYGLKLRTDGFMNYVDWRVKCEHYNNKGLVVKDKPVVAFLRKNDQGTWIAGKEDVA